MQDPHSPDDRFPRGGWRPVGSFHVDRPEPVFLAALARIPLSNSREEAVRVELARGEWEVAVWETPADGRVYDVRVGQSGRPHSAWDVDDVVVSPVDDGLRLLGWVHVGDCPGPNGVAVVLERTAGRFPTVPDMEASPAEVIEYWEQAARVARGFRAAAERGRARAREGAWTSRSASGQFPVVARFADGAVDEVRVSILPARVH